MPAVGGQNIFNSLKEKITGNTASEARKQNNKKSDMPDPLELSLDENLAAPAVPEKLHYKIVSHMNSLAKKLAANKRERVETMRTGEIIVVTFATDLMFEPNDTVLNRAANKLLQPYVGLMNQPGMYKLIAVCHTDNTGSESYTDSLSEARVNAVSEHLLQNANNDNHAVLVPYALGASDPLYPNNTMDNRSANRRLEIFIVPDALLIEMAKSNKFQ